MPVKRFSQQTRESRLGQLVNSQITDGSNLMDALEFMESPMGLGLSLYPVQRVLTKLIFGIPMDKYERKVPIYDLWCDKLLYTLSDTEYIKYLADNGRINITDWREAKVDGYDEADLIVGRRGGKTALVAGIGCYKLYKLLNLRDPQAYYGLQPGSPIDFTMMAQDGEGSDRLLAAFRADVNHAPFFAPFLRHAGDELQFISEADRNGRDVASSIKVVSLACTTNSVRGPSSILLLLDEFAFYRNQIGSNSDAMYEAAAPATMQFKAGGVREGKRESMILIITSPGLKIGKYYTLYRDAMEEGNASETLAFRCSTAEMNPRSDANFLHRQYRANPEKFMAEYGGEFLGTSGTFAPAAIIEQCVDSERKNVEHFSPELVGRKFFWGLDLGIRKDATALAVSHWEKLPERGVTLVFDYISRKMVGLGQYTDVKELPLDELLAWIFEVHQQLPCFDGATDQFGGAWFVQLLKSKEVEGMNLLHLTPAINSQMYLTLRNLMENKQVIFPDNPEFLQEMKLLEASWANKYQIKVEAPNEKNAHDDMADAVAISAYRAQQWALGDGEREIYDLSNSMILPPNPFANPNVGGWDINASLSHLKAVENSVRFSYYGRGGMKNIPHR